MTDKPESEKSETGSETGSVAENKQDTEEKPEVAEKEQLLNDEDRTDKTSQDSVKIMTEDHPNEDLEDNDPPAKKNEEDDEKVPFYKSLWFIILMSGQLSLNIQRVTYYDL